MGKTHRNSLKPGYRLHWYEIIKVLGQGGFGITYLARDTNLEKNVAIKEYLPIELAVREKDHSIHPLTEDRSKQYQWGLERFISEARTLSRYDHPNIVRVHAVFEENNTGYMVMSYEHGRTLQELLSGKKTMEEAALLKILIPILGGLELVHESGFVHRDIKPDNIFIREDGSPVLLDFGSARQALGEKTKTLTSLVTPGYAPFEQYYSKSDEQGPWTDIYGMGATLYRAIAGITPLDAVDRSKYLLEDKKDLYVPAVEIGKGTYSSRFLKAIDHALQFRQKDRPQSIHEWKQEFNVADDLAEIKRIEEIEKTPTQPGTKIIKPHRPGFRSSYLSIPFILILGVIIYYFQDQLSQIISGYMPEETDVTTIETPLDKEEIFKQKQQQEISKLLNNAESRFKSEQYLEPPGDNALEYYLKVIELEPNNLAAVGGKQKIFDHYLGLADKLLVENKFAGAEKALLKADIAKPESREVKLKSLKIKEKKEELERIAKEKEQQRLEEERKRLEEEQRLAKLEKQKQEEQRKKEEEEKRLAEEKRIKEEQKTKRLAELEKQRIEEEKRLADEARLAELERQRQVEEAKKQKEEEKKRNFKTIITEAEQAIINKNKNLAISKFSEALLLYPDDVSVNLGLKNAENLKHKLCYDVLGKWIWDKAFGQEIIILNEDGTIDYQISVKGSGSWECTNPENRIIKIRLSLAGFSNEWLSEYSADGTCLTGPETWGSRGCYHRSESDKKTVKPGPEKQIKKAEEDKSENINLVKQERQSDPVNTSITNTINEKSIILEVNSVPSSLNKWGINNKMVKEEFEKGLLKNNFELVDNNANLKMKVNVDAEQFTVCCVPNFTVSGFKKDNNGTEFSNSFWSGKITSGVSGVNPNLIKIQISELIDRFSNELK